MRAVTDTASPGIVPTPREGAALLAWLICGVTLSLLAVTAALVLAGRSRPLPDGFYPQWDGHLVSVIGAIGAPILGGLIAARRPENRYGWVWSGLGLTIALVLLVQGYILYAVGTDSSIPALGVLLLIAGAAWLAFFSLIAFAMLLFPSGSLPSNRWRYVAWTVVAGAFVALIPSAIVPGSSGMASVDNPFGVSGVAGRIASALVVAGVFMVFAGILLSALSLVFRYRRAGVRERQQIKWFVYAAALFGLGTIFYGFLGLELPGIWHSVMQTAELAAIYAAVGIAILKYRLLDIDLVINRTLVYGALTALVVGLYILVAGGLGMLLQAQGDFLISLVAAGLVAVLFAPLREWLQRGVNRLMYGRRDEPYEVLSRLGERLEATLEPDAALPALVETVREALKLPYAAVALMWDHGLSIAASSGTPVNEPIRLPLTYQGDPVGELILGLRTGEAEFGKADRRLLNDVARQAGVAVHALRLTEDLRALAADLQRSREQLILAGEEERRRLRRDLHDGLGPMLGSLTLKLDVACDLLKHDPGAARTLLSGLREQTQTAVSDVRRLVYALRPPALDDLGLVAALRQEASQYGKAGPLIRLSTPETLPPLPAAVEVAAYRIVQEALANVVRHAGACACAVELVIEESSGTLRLEIADDGRGIGASISRGVGLSSMAERAAELGGVFTVEPRPAGGTRVQASLPYDQPVEVHITNSGSP